MKEIGKTIFLKVKAPTIGSNPNYKQKQSKQSTKENGQKEKDKAMAVSSTITAADFKAHFHPTTKKVSVSKQTNSETVISNTTQMTNYNQKQVNNNKNNVNFKIKTNQ